MSMNFLQKENRMKGIPDATLKQMLIQMNQTGQVGTPEHILVAGELLDRKRTAQQAAIGKENKTPVIQDILNYVAAPQQPAMPPQQMAQAPTEAGIAAMRAPSAEQEFAAGGIVAFQKGGITLTDEQVAALMKAAQAKGRDLNPEFVVRAARDYDPAELKTLFDTLGVPFDTPIPTAAPVDVPALEPAPAGASLSDVMRRATLAEQKQYQQTGQLPERLQKMLTEGLPPPAMPTNIGRATELFTSSPGGVQTNAMGQTPSGGLAQFYPGMPALTQSPKVRLQQTDPGYIPPEGLAAQRQSVLGLPAQTSGVVPPPPKDEPPKEGDKITVQKKDDGVMGPGLGDTTKRPVGSIASTDGQGLYSLAQTLHGKLPDEITTTDKQAVEDRFKLYKEMGVDLDPYKKIKERLASADTEYAKQKNEAGLLALANFGFTLASTPGSVGAAVGKAGMSIMPGVMESVKDLRKLKREDEKLAAEVAAFDSRMAKDITDKARSEIQAERNRVIDRRNAIQDNVAKTAGELIGRDMASKTSMGIAQLGSETQFGVADINKQVQLYKLAQTLDAKATEEDIKNALNMVTKRVDYPGLARDPAKMEEAIRQALKNVKMTRRLTETTVTKN